jgi:hypothetical protein
MPKISDPMSSRKPGPDEPGDPRDECQHEQQGRRSDGQITDKVAESKLVARPQLEAAAPMARSTGEIAINPSAERSIAGRCADATLRRVRQDDQRHRPEHRADEGSNAREPQAGRRFGIERSGRTAGHRPPTAIALCVVPARRLREHQDARLTRSCCHQHVQADAVIRCVVARRLATARERQQAAG